MQGKGLVIAEKISLMNEIMNAYRENRNVIQMDLDFLTQAGHLLGLKEPREVDPKYEKWNLENYPIDVPYVYKIIPRTANLLREIKTALDSGRYSYIVHAGDPDNEGEILIRETLMFLGCTLPVKRFWSNDLTHGAIVSALQNMKDDREYDSKYYAALVRQHTDYQFGINTTGVATKKMNELYRLGRIKAAIIRILVNRERAIRDFIPHSTFKRTFMYQNAEFVNEDTYETLQDCVRGVPTFQAATITAVSDSVKAVKAPKLYKISTLQSDAYKVLKFSAKKTLDVAQTLYEARIISYPRSDCEYISSNVNLTAIITATASILKVNTNTLTGNVSKVLTDSTYVNDKKIASEGHTAIIPTGSGIFSGMGRDELALYTLISRRFLAIFAENKQIRQLTVTAVPVCDTQLGDFLYKETSDVIPGFETVLNPSYRAKQDTGLTFTKGQIISPVIFNPKEIEAKPPVRYNDGSIITVLDHPDEFRDESNKKVAYTLGTPATRAPIIEDCQACGYFTKEKGIFYATAKSECIIDQFGDIALFDITNSGRWEMILNQIVAGEIDYRLAEKQLFDECQTVTNDIKRRNIDTAAIKKEIQAGSAPLGKCPKCGADVVSGKYGAYCSAKCGLQLGKAMGKTLTESQISKALTGRKFLIKGLPSKKGPYNAYLKMKGVKPFTYTNKNGDIVNAFSIDYQMEYIK